MSDAVTPAPRERGWRRLLPALAAFVILPALPVFSTAVPIPETLPLLVSALAACALFGWWSGGRASLAFVWCALAAWVVAQPGESQTGHDWIARGWALLVAAAFGVVSLVGGPRPFFGRALSAVALAGALAGAAIMFAPRGPERAARVVRANLDARSAADLARWQAGRAKAEREGVFRKGTVADSVLGESEANLRALPGATASFYPALLALQSLAALALAWSLYHRVSRVRIGPVFAPLRDFRFSDQFVWGVITGLTALVLPTLEPLRGAGGNLVLFFGALYALRGLGVLAWFFTPRRSVAGILAGVALFLVLGPNAAVALGVVGVGDTWLDWRSRPRSTST